VKQYLILCKIRGMSYLLYAFYNLYYVK